MEEAVLRPRLVDTPTRPQNRKQRGEVSWATTIERAGDDHDE